MKPISQSIEPFRIWSPIMVYSAFVLDLLRKNPGVTEMVNVSKDPRKPKMKEIRSGGYWGKYNRRRDIVNFWVYTIQKMPDGRNKVVEVINFDRWKRIMDTYFMAARKYIIQGETLNMQSLLGYIEARHIERNHANKQVNFNETAKQPKVMNAEGKMVASKVIYHTDDDYVRIAWRKLARIPNEKAYEFKPTRGDEKGMGFMQEFSQANQKHPTLRHNYRFYPYPYSKKSANAL